jgi:hypothetical protein
VVKSILGLGPESGLPTWSPTPGHLPREGRGGGYLQRPSPQIHERYTLHFFFRAVSSLSRHKRAREEKEKEMSEEECHSPIVLFASYS